MMIKKPITKEHLVDYLLKNISLGTYDKKFISNLLAMNIATGKAVTTNQSSLLDKITLRYTRQLAKNELSSVELVELSWSTTPIESSPLYTEAHISILDDEKIIIHSPYKKEFVKQLKQVSYMEWDKPNKMWTAPASPHTLQLVLEAVTSHYDKVNYFPIVQRVLTDMSEYEDMRYWNPTLTRINGNLFIVAANASLMDAIAHLQLDTHYHTLARLSRSGIRIDPSLINDIHDELGGTDEVLNKLIFAINPSPTMEVNDQTQLMIYLRDIKADMVLLTPWFGLNKSYIMTLANLLKANNIEHRISTSKVLGRGPGDVDLKDYEMPVKINMGMFHPSDPANYLAKNIQLVNSNEIYIE